MAHLQPTFATTSSLYRSGFIGTVVPLQIRRKAGFASTTDSSSSRSAALSYSLQARSSISNNSTHQDIVRPLEKFSPHIWGDRFITLPFTNSEFEWCSRQVEVLKEMVKDMFMTSIGDPIENIYLINSLCRLGVSYHLETEIEKQLSHLFITLPQLMDNKDYDLHTVAVIFQLFRSHGYRMTCDVFNKFKNGDGMFKEELFSNIKGMISLYEASHWGMHGELILDETLAFTTLHLESLVSQSCPDHLREYIANALNRPYHKGMPTLEARQYISFYEKDESRNHILLNFAKYDFNRVQMHLQQELSLLSSWWEESNIGSRFPHVRQRIVESFFSGVVVLFEPRFALGRSAMTKWSVALLLMDDTYDAYGLYEELPYLTKALERFDISAMDELPVDYLKCLYEAILNISDEVGEEVSKEGRSFSFSYTKEELKKVALTYDVQARWTHERIMPSFDEYLENGLRSVGAILCLTLLMTGMEEADEETYQWLIKCDAKILRTTGILSRLYNDSKSNEDEEKRGGQLSGITCYMKEYGVSKKEVIEGYKERIRVGWKDLNEGFMVTPTSVARQILLATFNFARLADVIYKDDDGFTKPEITLKHYITKVLIDPIPLQD
ncbi:hypothetical protein REPUB_Repub11eG0133500 [Reevesia pubescens]